MSYIDKFTDDERRYLAHIYAALRERIDGELCYNCPPGFPAMEHETKDKMFDVVCAVLTRLMVGAHALEAAKLDTQSEYHHGAN